MDLFGDRGRQHPADLLALHRQGLAHLTGTAGGPGHRQPDSPGDQTAALELITFRVISRVPISCCFPVACCFRLASFG